MAVTANVIHIIGGLAEFLTIVICFNFLEIYSKAKIGKTRILLSLIVYITITVAFLFLNGFYNRFAGLAMAVLYTVKNLFALFIIYRTINKILVFLTLFIDLSASFISSCVSCFLANIFKTAQEDIDIFVTFFIQIIILFVFFALKRKIDTQKTLTVLRLIPERIYALLILSVICLSALTSLVSFNTDNLKTKESLLLVIIIIQSVILTCIVVSLILNVIAKQHFTVTSQMMEKQVELQISHYEELEKIDGEMRRFRHDYTNHLQSILSLIQMKAYPDTEEYIKKIKKTAYISGAIMFYSGNKLADAILTDKSAALDENCQIEYSGIMPASIENVDLCIILSNALDNAIEACRELHSPCTISMSAGEQQGYFVMSLKNPTACSNSFYDIPPTTKLKKEQHGMGLYNIESTVKKYNGQMKIKCENGIFELMITMKL